MATNRTRRQPPITRRRARASGLDDRPTHCRVDIIGQSIVALTNARLAAKVLGPLLARDTIDVFGVACLSARRRLLAWHQLDRRTPLRRTPTHDELLFAPTLAPGTEGVVIVQAHPDDDPRPMRRDLILTMRLALAADTLDVPLLDHLIVDRSGERYFSVCESGLADATDSYLNRPIGHHVRDCRAPIGAVKPLAALDPSGWRA